MKTDMTRLDNGGRFGGIGFALRLRANQSQRLPALAGVISQGSPIAMSILVGGLLLSSAILVFQSRAAPGDVDLSFDPNGGIGFDDWVRSIVRQVDGKVLIRGSFTTVDGVIRAGFARLNSILHDSIPTGVWTAVSIRTRATWVSFFLLSYSRTAKYSSGARSSRSMASRADTSRGFLVIQRWPSLALGRTWCCLGRQMRLS